IVIVRYDAVNRHVLSFPTRRSSDLEDRLRFNLDKDHVNELATAFRTEDLINPIVVDRDTNLLVAGAHRYGAYELNQLLKIEPTRSEEHTSELQSRENLVCRLLLEKK